jgi:hypothetical protein
MSWNHLPALVVLLQPLTSRTAPRALPAPVHDCRATVEDWVLVTTACNAAYMAASVPDLCLQIRVEVRCCMRISVSHHSIARTITKGTAVYM